MLALSFGYAGVQSIITILRRLSQETALATQTATINRPLAEQPLFDLAYQLLGFVGELAPVALVAYLLWRTAAPHLGNLGLGRLPGRGGRWWLADTGWGVVLAAAIGIPGLAFYLFSRIIGINANVVPTALDAYWWTVPVLVLSALRHALGEELIVVAYFFDRMRRIGVGPWATILASALLRGSYHLYQGFGGFVGNIVMGVVFGLAYLRLKRVGPLVAAHFLLDLVAFVGYSLLAPYVDWL